MAYPVQKNSACSNSESESDARKVSILLHHLGSDCLHIFSSFQLDMDTVKHEDLMKKFTEYFSPKENITMERNKLFNKKQTSSQSIMDFVTELKLMANSCDFQEKDSIIRDILICNMRSEFSYIKEKLLENGDLSLEKAIETATSLEASRQRVSQLENGISQEIHKVSETFSRSISRQPQSYGNRSHSQAGNHSQSRFRSQSQSRFHQSKGQMRSSDPSQQSSC